jgi:DNA-binding Lrp family transcriptional regulator
MDETDLKILDLLEVNGRETVSALASKVGLSRSSVKERIDRLEKEGEIEGYTIKRKTRRTDAMVRAYLMIKTNGALCHQIAPHLEKMPEVKFFESLSGEIDALVCVETVDTESLGELRDKVAAFHQVSDIQTLSVLKTRIAWR